MLLSCDCSSDCLETGPVKPNYSPLGNCQNDGQGQANQLSSEVIESITIEDRKEKSPRRIALGQIWSLQFLERNNLSGREHWSLSSRTIKVPVFCVLRVSSERKDQDAD